MHFKRLNNCNWPTCSSPEPKACNMGSFSLIKSSTDTFWRKPHRMERIISPSSATQAACLSSHRHQPNPWGHHHHGAGHGSATPASPRTLCCEPGGAFPLWIRTPGLSPSLATCRCHPGGRSPALAPATPSISGDKLLLQGAFVGTPRHGERWGGLCGSPLGLGAAPPLPARGGRR